MADFIVGSPARGDDFWFREEFVDNLWVSIKKHNVLLVAPRRIGKTSVMYRMLENPKDNWMVIHLNVEDIKSPPDFFITLLDAIREHQPAFLKDFLAKGWDFFKGLIAGIEQVEAYDFKIQLRKKENLKENWQERIAQLVERVMRSGLDVLFIIDELPDMLNNMLLHSHDEYVSFLHWFRKTRELSLKARIRWLIGGSVNLVSVLDKSGNVKLINDLKPEVLLPFTQEEVTTFITEMFNKEGVRYDSGVIRKINELLGSPIPYFLQMITQELCRVYNRNPDEQITGEKVAEVFNKTLLGDMARDKLQHYRSRIDVHYAPEERDAACRLLNHLSLCENGASHRVLYGIYIQIEDEKTNPRNSNALMQAFQRLLLHLQSDFYIEETKNGKFDFASRLIKVWWKKYYGFEYTEE